MTEIPSGSAGNVPQQMQPTPVAPLRLKQSGWGIASFVLGCICVVIVGFPIVVSVLGSHGLLGFKDGPVTPPKYVDHTPTPESEQLACVGAVLCSVLMLPFAGVVSGIIGVRHRQRRHGMALAGLIMSSVMLVFGLVGAAFVALFVFSSMGHI